MSGLSGLSNHWRERSFLACAAVGFFGLGMSVLQIVLPAWAAGVRLFQPNPVTAACAAPPAFAHGCCSLGPRGAGPTSTVSLPSAGFIGIARAAHQSSPAS